MNRRNQIEQLLEQIRERTDELRLLRTYGVTRVALDGRKRELLRARQQLAAIVGH